MDADHPRRSTRRFRRPQPGEEICLCLRAGLSRELALPKATARIHELRAAGVDRVTVRVVKAPRVESLAEEDAVKVEVPELAEADHPTLYVRVKFLDLPAV